MREKDIILSDYIDDSSLYTDILIDTTYTDNIDIISSTIFKNNDKNISSSIIKEYKKNLSSSIIDAYPNNLTSTIIKDYHNNFTSTLIKDYLNNLTSTIIKDCQNSSNNTIINDSNNINSTMIKDYHNNLTSTIIKDYQNNSNSSIIKDYQYNLTNTMINDYNNNLTSTKMKEYQNNLTSTIIKHYLSNFSSTIIGKEALNIFTSIFKNSHYNLSSSIIGNIQNNISSSLIKENSLNLTSTIIKEKLKNISSSIIYDNHYNSKSTIIKINPFNQTNSTNGQKPINSTNTTIEKISGNISNSIIVEPSIDTTPKFYYHSVELGTYFNGYYYFDINVDAISIISINIFKIYIFKIEILNIIYNATCYLEESKSTFYNFKFKCSFIPPPRYFSSIKIYEPINVSNFKLVNWPKDEVIIEKEILYTNNKFSLISYNNLEICDMYSDSFSFEIEMNSNLKEGKLINKTILLNISQPSSAAGNIQLLIGQCRIKACHHDRAERYFFCCGKDGRCCPFRGFLLQIVVVQKDAFSAKSILKVRRSHQVHHFSCPFLFQESQHRLAGSQDLLLTRRDPQRGQPINIRLLGPGCVIRKKEIVCPRLSDPGEKRQCLGKYVVAQINRSVHIEYPEFFIKQSPETIRACHTFH